VALDAPYTKAQTVLTSSHVPAEYSMIGKFHERKIPIAKMSTNILQMEYSTKVNYSNGKFLKRYIPQTEMEYLATDTD
jgi:hypothetical protein